MKIAIAPTYTATLTIGQQIGYSDAQYSKEVLIELLQAFQQQQIKERQVYLSASVTPCEIVLSGQVEPHLKLEFINYPKFPMPEADFKKEIELLTVFLMQKLKQNRVVIVYHNETKMYEQNKNIDPRI